MDINQIPEHLRTAEMQAAAAKALEQANSMAASSNSIPRLTFAGREFTLKENGENVAKFKDFLDIIILGVDPDGAQMAKTFYMNGYNPDAKEPPDCASDDGIAPSPWVLNKQNPTCKTCPKNQFGSATSPSGKATKACRDSKRIWFRVADGNEVNLGPGKRQAYDAGPFDKRTVFGANVTVASLKSFSDYGRQLMQLGQPPCVAITRMVMAEGVSYPQVEFSIVGWVDAEKAPLALEINEKKPWKIQFKNASLALANDGGGRAALPSALPGVPTHLQKPAASQSTGLIDGQISDAVEVQSPVAAVEQKVVSNKDIDDAVSQW